MSKHTPGTWEPSIKFGGTVWVGKECIAEVSSHDGKWDTVEANARLIAAAPEMKSALDPDWAMALYEFILREFREDDPTTGRVVTADVWPHFDALCNFMSARSAALAKAKGQP